jgi:P2-related tail formation protein
MSEVCKDVQKEPQLLPLSGEAFERRSNNITAEARLDISARGIWNTVDKTFFFIEIFQIS